MSTQEEANVDEVIESAPEVEAEESDEEVIEKSLLDSDDDADDSDDEDADEKVADDSDDDGSEIVYEKPDITEILGEGAEFDETLWAEALPLFKKAGLTQEEVNERVKKYAESSKRQIEDHSKMLIEQYNKIKDDWRAESMEEFKTDFKQTLKRSGTFIKKFGDQEALDILNETGVGNQKAIIRMLSKAGKHLVEDSLVDGEPETSTSAEDVLYPSMKK